MDEYEFGRTVFGRYAERVESGPVRAVPEDGILCHRTDGSTRVARHRGVLADGERHDAPRLRTGRTRWI